VNLPDDVKQEHGMSKFWSFTAGALSGALVGGVATLLFTPKSGEDLIADAEARWQAAVDEANRARLQKQLEMKLEFEAAKRP
jgi:gas vesicle protein